MTVYLAKLGELTLKHSNIKVFERRLVSNLKRVLYGIDKVVSLKAGRLYIECADADCKKVETALSHLIGIAGWAKTYTAEKTIQSITECVTKIAKEAAENGAKTFKIEARRQDKSFCLNSYGICCEAAAETVEKGILKVDVKNPDVKINIEVRDKCYVYLDTKKARQRGLPVGTSGRGLLLLSGGIDSPVAGYRMASRGMTLSALYFHAYPYTSNEAKEKVITLASILSMYALNVTLYIIPFTEVQMRIKERAKEDWTTIMLRVCMMKAANAIAERDKAKCIITGESLGQVASQTIENICTVDSFAALPVFRPLIGMDKEEIVKKAKEIGSYETSILPYEDCCVLFAPRHPVLKGTVEEAKKMYAALDIDTLIEKALKETEVKEAAYSDALKTNID